VDRRDEYGNWQDTGGHGDRWGYAPDRYDDERIAAPRSPEPRYGPAPMSGPPMRGPRPGEPAPDPLYDPIPDPRMGPDPRGPMPQDQVYHQPTGQVDAAAMRRKVKETDGLYHSRKPIFIAIYGLIAFVAELMMLPPFVTHLFKIESLAPMLAMMAFPLLALGMYGLSTGAATAVQFQGPRVWLRLPLIYLPIGIGLLIAAGTAAK
jgi:hypothetical protein